jgi:ABC-type microcin C transport system duplicated ATPase subunit YejF
MIGLLPPRRSHVEGGVAGHEITSMSEGELREVRGTKIAMIFQEPMNRARPGLHDRRADCRDDRAARGHLA